MNQGPNLPAMFISIIFLLVILGIVMSFMPKMIRKLLRRAFTWTVTVLWELFKWLWEQLCRLVSWLFNLVRMFLPI